MFDLLYLNGKPLIREPFIERRRLLRENFKEVEEQFLFAKSLDTNVLEEMQEFLEESVKGSLFICFSNLTEKFRVQFCQLDQYVEAKIVFF